MTTTKKDTVSALKSHGHMMMDKAVRAKFGCDCQTVWSDRDKKWITAIGGGDLNPDVTIYIAGYQKALADMFIAARL